MIPQEPREPVNQDEPCKVIAFPPNRLNHNCMEHANLDEHEDLFCGICGKDLM